MVQLLAVQHTRPSSQHWEPLGVLGMVQPPSTYLTAVACSYVEQIMVEGLTQMPLHVWRLVLEVLLEMRLGRYNFLLMVHIITDSQTQDTLITLFRLEAE